MLKVQDGIIFFSSGRMTTVYAGVIGLSADCSEVHGGYDDCLSDDLGELTQEEKIELADYMISQWQKFKDNA